MDETVKATSNKPSVRPNNSHAGAHKEREGAEPLKRLCKIIA